MTKEELTAVDRALTKTISHMIVFADDIPYADDPRRSKWSRWQKPLAERCRAARAVVRQELAIVDDE